MQSAGNRLGSAMIQFTDVSVRFGDRQVLKNISMTVPFGETLAILGGSGAGKTTILRLIEGLWQPDTGSIMIDGQEIVGLSEQQMTHVRNTMALVFQGSALFDYDEPTAGLDPINTHIIKELICRLHGQEHVTQIVVTHDVETAYQVADDLIMIHQGEKIFDGTGSALKMSTDERVQAFLHPDAVLAASDEAVYSAAR